MKKINLIGIKFHRLLVIAAGPVKYYGKTKKPRITWLCKCDCGNVTTVVASHLNVKTDKKSTKSCGCLNIELYPQNAERLRIANTKYHPSIATARKVWKDNYDDGCSFEDFYNLSQMPCYYCETPPANLSNVGKHDKKSSKIKINGGDFCYNGLDRLDSNKDHSINNVVSCCKWCNYAKRERTVEEFKNWIKQLYTNFAQKETDSSFLESVPKLIQPI